METELFKKVYIRSEEDLPKEEGFYFVGLHGNFDIKVEVFRLSNDPYIIEDWISVVDWYLIPVEITDKAIIDAAYNTSMRLTPDGHTEPDIKYYDGYIAGARAVLNDKIPMI